MTSVVFSVGWAFAVWLGSQESGCKVYLGLIYIAIVKTYWSVRSTAWVHRYSVGICWYHKDWIHVGFSLYREFWYSPWCCVISRQFLRQCEIEGLVKAVCGLYYKEWMNKGLCCKSLTKASLWTFCFCGLHSVHSIAAPSRLSVVSCFVSLFWALVIDSETCQYRGHFIYAGK